MNQKTRHEALVAAAMLGIVKSKGWMEMPVIVDVNKAIADMGPVKMRREHAIVFARGLIDKMCEVNSWKKPNFGDQETSVLALLGEAYDELVKATS